MITLLARSILSNSKPPTLVFPILSVPDFQINRVSVQPVTEKSFLEFDDFASALLLIPYMSHQI